MALALSQATVKKGVNTILENINWTIEIGENWAIIGENGSGKTSLLQVLASKHRSLTVAKDFRIVLLETDFKNNRLVNPAYQYYQQRYHTDGAELAPSVYEVIQNQVKPLNTTNEASVSLPPKLYSDDAVEYWAKLLNINHLLHQRIVTLSNGETRRTHLLAALLKKPNMLLLDNPFIGLDVLSRRTLHNILNQITEKGIQIVLVCAPDDIPNCVDNALVLKQGTIERILRGSEILDLKQAQRPVFTLPHADLIAKIESQPAHDNFEYAVRFRNLTIKYRGENVIDGINWEIKKGEKWALLGPNGSGKSTLLSLITADNPQGYRNDYDLFDRKRGSGESIWDIKKRIGFVSPELQLYTNTFVPVWRVVASGLFDTAELYKPLSKLEAEKVGDFLKLFDLYTLKDRPLHQLSSGQQRSVFLARALVKNPPLLILDEPCQGLDAEHTARFRDLVNELAITLNKTLIYVTHYENEIPACVNQVFKIDKGKRIE